MDYRDYRDAISRELSSLILAVEAGPASTPVPSCPGWTVADLGLHVGQVCGFWTHVLCEGSGRPKTPYPEEPAGDGLVKWLRTVGDYLVSELRTTPADTEVWTWHAVQNSAKFVARRMANELAVHRYDAQSASDNCSAISADLAADGIDEMLTVLVPARERSGQATGQTLHLHATDADVEWFIRLLPDRIEATREHAKADLALRGPISDLELLLYGRPTLGEVERFGDGSVLDLWHKEFTF
jgi:uncharacterized protein (TIGR03083 family)